ncbi:MAG: hypothetical protein ABIZ04_17050 [Opitutus sp.]
MSPDPTRSRERERVEDRTKPPATGQGYLSRLAPEFYRGRAFVHWTLTVQNRATGWLNPTFSHAWQLTLLHVCSRFALVCPAYVLMPDHLHLLLLGLNETGSDQRTAIEFLRKQLRDVLAPVDWQRQAHDHVLREKEREHDAFRTVAHYIFENPVRAGLIDAWGEYPYTGCCVAGYPALDVRAVGYWELFWRIYGRLITSA